ncbi:MAG TPA: acyl-CoA dehydrogenase family protein [Thermoplasmata archaeon]|nr:acyl-CoA dehydrogenase family protein [Thermoplasmata archaeon]
MAELWPLPDDPIVAEIREFDRRYRLAAHSRELDQAPAFPRREFRAMGEARLLGLTAPPQRGGRGLSLPRAATALFHLGYLGGTVFAKLSLQPEFCSVLSEHGSSELVERWLRPLLRGERLVGNQITEPAAGSDVGAIDLVAERRGEEYLLSGTKSEAAFAEDAEAAIVYARAPGSSGPRGISAFLVPQDLPGVRRTVAPSDLGEHWQRRGSIEYTAVRVPANHRLGAEGEGLSYVRPELARERGLLAAIYLGIARASWDETVRYVSEREAFGRPLSDQQAVAFPLLDDGVHLEAAWQYTVRSLERLGTSPESEARTALAKVLAADVALTTIDHAIQFHGGRGYSGALPHEQRWRDVRSGPIAHGPSDVLRRGAARTLWPRRPADNP